MNKAKIEREMKRDQEIHQRGHFTVSERVLVDAIVDIIQNQRMVEVPVDFDPVRDPLNAEVLRIITG